jgi:microcystin-dependent protein
VTNVGDLISNTEVRGETAPTGTIVAFGGATAPAGWELCQGAYRSSTDGTYIPLFNVIGYAFGQSGSNFRLPDLQGRVPMGVDAGAGRIGSHPNTLGGAAGVETHTLSLAEIPAHNHYINSYPAWASGSGWVWVGTGGVGASTSSSSAAGGGAAHTNLQPYGVTEYIIKL